MRVFQISLLTLGLVLLLSSEAQALVCINDVPEPYSAKRFIPRMYGHITQGGWHYLIYTLVVVIAYYITRRFKPSISQKATLFVLIAGFAGMHAIQQSFFGSSGGYCTGPTEEQYRAELAGAWCLVSLIFYGCYRLILLVPERYRHFVAIGTPIGMAIGLPALSFLIFMLTR